MYDKQAISSSEQYPTPHTYPSASSIHIPFLPDCTGTSDQLLIVSRIHQHPCIWRVGSTLTHTPAFLITRSLG